MNVGLPGTGIGGLFYLLTALMMPVVELFHTLRGRSTWLRWRTVTRQALLAAGALLGLFMTGWLLKHCMPHEAVASLRLVNDQATRAMGVTPTRLTVVTLLGVLLAVEVLRSLNSLFERLLRKA